MALRTRMRAYRLAKGLSCAQVGVFIGVKRDQVSKLERGVSHTTTEKLMKLCELYECRPNDLLQPDDDLEMTGANA